MVAAFAAGGLIGTLAALVLDPLPHLTTPARAAADRDARR